VRQQAIQKSDGIGEFRPVQKTDQTSGEQEDQMGKLANAERPEICDARKRYSTPGDHDCD